MCGHWSKEISNAYIQDLANPPPVLPQVNPAGASDTVVSHVAAMSARRAYRYAMNRVQRYTRSTVAPGVCDTCGWHTDWEKDEAMQCRVQCFKCSKRVCRKWCCVPEFLVCKTCHPGDELPGPAVMPKQVPRTETADACFSCGRARDELAAVAAGSADSRAGRQPLRRCVRCNRWLCFDCRQTQAPTVCVVCPAFHTVELPSLRQASTGPSAVEVERLREAANRATASRGRGRLSSGQYLHQQNIDGRAERTVRGTGKRARLDE
jgi:hypothetical protein